MARRTFKLLKDSIEFKKGTIVQEACDDGDQAYLVLDIKPAFKFDDWEQYLGDPNCFFSRDTVEKSPSWFVEVFPVPDGVKWLTKEELKKVKALKLGKK